MSGVLALAGRERWSWLIAPSPENFGFAVRTSCAALVSLFIAMWMEMGSPQWAPLTVWVVATASRGETIAKARWRLAGTVAGCCAGVALIAAFPQAAALFFIGLAAWTGSCCGLATFFDGYRSYGFLVAGFTTAIVATDAIGDPDHAFLIAMSRGTYIILGIVCEALAGGIFSPDMEGKARARLMRRLAEVSALTDRTLAAWRREAPDSAAESGLLASVMAAGARIEFDVLEMGPAAGRTADHARAALAALLAAMARRNAGADEASVSRSLSLCSEHIAAIEHPARRDRFRFPVRSVRLAAEARRNGVRSAAGILLAGLLWEVTAWSAGVAFISYVALVYGLLATREIPALASAAFLRGALWCAGVAAVYVVLVVPAVTSPEVLALLLMVPMVVGGLAARTPRLINYAFSFNMFLPVLIGPSNMGRYDEVSFLNGTMAFLGAVIFACVVFHAVLIFRPDSHLRQTMAWARRSLGGLARPGNVMPVERWLMISADSMVRAMRTAQDYPREQLFARFVEHMRIMTAGMCVIELRNAATGGHLPPVLARQIRVFLRTWVQDQGRAVALVPVLLRHLEKSAPERADVAASLRGILRTAEAPAPV